MSSNNSGLPSESALSGHSDLKINREQALTTLSSLKAGKWTDRSRYSSCLRELNMQVLRTISDVTDCGATAKKLKRIFETRYKYLVEFSQSDRERASGLLKSFNDHLGSKELDHLFRPGSYFLSEVATILDKDRQLVLKTYRDRDRTMAALSTSLGNVEKLIQSHGRDFSRENGKYGHLASMSTKTDEQWSEMRTWKARAILTARKQSFATTAQQEGSLVYDLIRLPELERKLDSLIDTIKIGAQAGGPDSVVLSQDEVKSYKEVVRRIEKAERKLVYSESRMTEEVLEKQREQSYWYS